MGKIIRSLILFGLVSGLLCSCIREDIGSTPPQGEEAAVAISAGLTFNQSRAGVDDEGDPADRIVREFRILAYGQDGRLAYNLYNPDLSSSMPYTFHVVMGTYDFVFIGNEGSDPALVSKLAYLPVGSSMTELDNMVFASTAFETGKNIPMTTKVKNVEIVGDLRYIIDGVDWSGTWDVKMKRLGVRLDFTIFTQSAGKQSSFKRLEVFNIPKNVPLFETTMAGATIYNGGSANYEATARGFDVTMGDGGGFLPEAGGYKWTLSRVIIPSSLFTSDAESEAVGVRVVYNDGQTSEGVLKTGITGDYQMPRNTFVEIDVNILQTFEMYLKASNWDDKPIDIAVGSKVSLNVSSFKTAINERNRARIWFWSDQEEVKIDDRLSNNALVNDVFNDLTGSDAYNFHYTYDPSTKQGTGYIDIMTDANLPGSGSGTYTFYLNAGGLRRAITVTVSSNDQAIGSFEYVGAFWRNDETGERLISGKAQKTWKAEVIDGLDWIILAPGKSLDPNVWSETKEPDDAENYQVEGNETVIGGGGWVYFRIGLTSKNIGNPPRYGRVKLTVDATEYMLYIRQGEDADYIFRPGDPDGNGNFVGKGSISREAAVKFSPYNLTESSIKNGTNNGGDDIKNHPTIGSGQKGVFVEYPSQAGAQFHWVMPGTGTPAPKAFHPVQHYSDKNMTGWISTGMPTGYWNTHGTNYEKCPDGYRRPLSGRIDRAVTSRDYDTEYSELLHSLSMNPVSVVTAYTTETARYGYYADGFFDRRFCTDALSSYDSNEKSAVHNTKGTVAYTGCLLFNKYTNASIFFPSAGFRISSGSNTGRLRETGRVGYYMSATASNSSVWTMVMADPRQGSNMQAMSPSYYYVHSIRCVKDE